MVLDEPAGCTWCCVRGSARGEGDLVGDTCVVEFFVIVGVFDIHYN